jgi:hypothetical protein
MIPTTRLPRTRTHKRKLAVLVVFALVALPALAAMAAPGTVIYESQPNPLPGNVVSRAFQATQTTEFGDQITFASGPRELGSASVVFSSWACQTGTTGAGGNCMSTPGATFTHPITLNLYEVDAAAPTGVGALITSVTQDVAVPYRPSADPACAANGGWGSPDCFNGFAFTVEFDLSGATVPDEIIFSIAFNTGTYGNPPLGVTGPYDSLNVGLVPTSVPPVTGTDADANVVFANTPAPPISTLGFRAQTGGTDPGAEPGFTVAARFTTVETPDPPVEPPVPPAEPGEDLVGLVDTATGIWNLRGAAGGVTTFYYGDPGDVPFAGDWDCDGVDTPGLYRQSDGFVYLRNSNTQGIADIRFFFGNPGDIPMAGDFDNDGCDTVSIYRPSETTFYVINELGANNGGLGPADFSFIFGDPGDKPFVGDFNGDGIDTIGLHRESTGIVYFRQSNTTGIADAEFFYGDPGDRFVAGDWVVVDDVDTPGVYRPSNATFFLRNSNTQGVGNVSFPFGTGTEMPIAGIWGP